MSNHGFFSVVADDCDYWSKVTDIRPVIAFTECTY